MTLMQDPNLIYLNLVVQFILTMDLLRLETTDKTTNSWQLLDFTIELWYNIHNYNTDWEAIISKAYNVSYYRIYKKLAQALYKKWYGGSGGSTLMSTTDLASDSNRWFCFKR